MLFDSGISEFLTPEVLARTYAALWLIEFGLMGRWLGMYFRTENHRGYRDPYQIPLMNKRGLQNAIISLWGLLHLAILFSPLWTPALIVACLFNHRYFVLEKWKSLSRGMGAPGYMLYWMSVCVSLLTISMMASDSIQASVKAVVVVDFAAIMTMAGAYKFRAGYRNGFGIEFGMVHPQWCYFPSLFSRLKVDSVIFRVLNELSWSLEIIGGLLLLHSNTRALGVLIIASSFLFLLPLIRLGALCLTVIACTGVVLVSNSQAWWPFVEVFAGTAKVQERIVALVAVAYVLGMLTTRMVQIVNVFGHRRLWTTIQTFTDSFSRVFGITLWRVFTPDVTAFTVEIETGLRGLSDNESEHSRARESCWGRGRFALVEEAIAVTSIFTLRRYFPGQVELFRHRLVRHANSLIPAADGQVRYRYVEVQKTDGAFKLTPTAWFTVNVHESSVVEKVLPESNIDKPIGPSPVRSGVRLGSYLQLDHQRER